MLIFKSSSETEGDIYYSHLHDKRWTDPIKIQGGINSKYNETDATISPDRKAIYFTSDRPGGYGGTDIYVCYRNEHGEFDAPQNLGPKINTSKDEEGPYMHADGTTLYFSSKGHSTMGGFDIFIAQKDSSNNWTEPENIGYPLNTVFDDVFLIPSVDGKRAYYSSVSNGVSNIFKADILDAPEKSLTLVSGFAQNCKIDSSFIEKELALFTGDTLKTKDNYWVEKNRTFENDHFISTHIIESENKYIVIDSVCNMPPNTKITVFKLSNESIVDQNILNNKTGKFQFVLPSAENYLVQYSSKGYMPKTQVISDTVKAYKSVHFNAELDSLDEMSFDQRYIVFPVAEIHLSKSSEFEMRLLAEFLAMNPHLFIDISGNFTNDSLGNEKIKSISSIFENNGLSKEIIFKSLWDSKWGNDTLQLTIFSSSYPQFKELMKAREAKETKKTTETHTKKVGLQIQNILFDKAKSDPKSVEEKLKPLVLYLKNNPETVLMIEGHTDKTGTDEYNDKLSLNRAMAVWNYLTENGVSLDQLMVRPVGNKQAIAIEYDEQQNHIDEGAAYNRRVEFNVVTDNGGLEILPIEVPEKYKIK
jgi:outer membrane protein OmpA-like peptidoglycan-associated protein